MKDAASPPLRAWTYILRCGDGTLYTGWTSDLSKRLTAHQMGKASRYTRARLPVTLVYAEAFAERKQAMQREYAIKQLPRAAKDQLVASTKGV